MDLTTLERPQFFAVLKIVRDRPGSTASAIAGAHSLRDKTKEVRLADLTATGLIEARPDKFKGRTVRRFFLTPKGEDLLVITALIERL